MSQLWRGHAATPHQQTLCFDPESKKPRRKRAGPTQADVLLEMLRTARAADKPLDLPDIMHAGIAQHGARLTELREQGFGIINDMQRSDGVVRSWYRLVFDPEKDSR